eukprot:4171173-Prymnesium_polylepis.1
MLSPPEVLEPDVRTEALCCHRMSHHGLIHSRGPIDRERTIPCAPWAGPRGCAWPAARHRLSWSS